MTREASGLFTLRKELIFEKEADSETWVKGEIWAPNFVPRVNWNARTALDVENFNLPAEVGVIGHHTAGRVYQISKVLSL